MKKCIFPIIAKPMVCVLATICVFFCCHAAFGQHAKVLYAFWEHAGAILQGELVSDGAGNLYGTTYIGGTGNCTGGFGTGCGSVYELSPQTDGSWTEQTLYSFQNDGTDGIYPDDCTLLRDSLGNLYGTTTNGGDSNSRCLQGCGTVFELSPQSGGGWIETQLHRFNGKDGQYPEAGLTRDAQGHLYGTTAGGGTNTDGVIFRLARQPNGNWIEKVLYQFGSSPDDGFWPNTLVLDKAGNLFGTTLFGGTGDCPVYTSTCGIVFDLALQPDGSYTENILHDFQGDGVDGYSPNPGLILDTSGNLYGTTYQGGNPDCLESGDCGIAFELSPQSDGSWSETILAAFYNPDSGMGPVYGLTFDFAGNLWGTTQFGGQIDDGAIFELIPQPEGDWKEIANGKFFSLSNGLFPESGLFRNATGRLFGITAAGGGNSAGTLYGIKP